MIGHFTKENLAFPRPVTTEETELKKRVGSSFVWELTDKGKEEIDTKPIELDDEDEALLTKFIHNRPKIGT